MAGTKSWMTRVGLTVVLVASVLVAAPDPASAAGTVTNYPVSGVSSDSRITSGPGGLWLTDYFGSAIKRITTSGTVTTFPTSLRPYAIAEGADGALWFTNPIDHQIGRLTATGTETYFPPGGSLNIYSAQGIARGPDGAMWFTNFNVGKIGRITTAGVLTYFDAVSGMKEITAGPDNAMWFTYPGGTIGRVDMTGSVSYFTDPAIVGPASITTGPDGNLWFTNIGTDTMSIGRLTPAGVVTVFPVSDALQYITAGPDGALWFTKVATDGGEDRVSRITTSGSITDYDVDFAYAPMGPLAFGSDGRLWFTNGSGIAKLVPVLGVYTSSLPTGQVASPYSTTLVATDGVAPYSWSLDSGPLPPGLSLSAAGVISGTPTAVAVFPVVVRVTDSDGPPKTATRALSINIQSDQFSITTLSLAPAHLNTPYNVALSAANGVPPYKWKKLTKMPKGIKFAAKTGTILGIPKKVTGAFTVTFQARYKTKLPKQKAVWHYATKTFTLIVN